jgi:hypothetical protein
MRSTCRQRGTGVSNSEIRDLRKTYLRTLKEQSEASEDCKELWRKTISVCDEVLRRRKAQS